MERENLIGCSICSRYININLFSSGRVVDKGLQMISDQNSCKFIKDGRIVAVGERKRRLYEMKFKICRKADFFFFFFIKGSPDFVYKRAGNYRKRGSLIFFFFF